jgi:hypothetical protein
MTAGGRPRQMFVSYAHADSSSMTKSLVFLNHIAKSYSIPIWNDRRLNAGSYWDAAIERAILSSDIFILLVSPDFFNSEYIYDTELPLIVKQHKDRDALLLPIILHGDGWRGEFAKYVEILPKDKNFNFKPLNKWRPQDDGWSACQTRIVQAIADWSGVQPTYKVASLLGATP